MGEPGEMAAVFLAIESLIVLAELAVIELQSLIITSGDAELAGVVEVEGGYFGAFGEV